MPRCYLNRKETRQKEFAKYVFGEMKVEGITLEEMAYDLGISRQTFSTRLKNGTLTFNQLVTIFEVLKTDAGQIGKFMKISK